MKIAIVEDERQAAAELAAHLKRFSVENGVFFEVTEYRDAVALLDKYHPNFDLVFMDIEMPHINGMEAARRLRELDRTVLIIFVTNMVQYAVKGYEVEALDFIVKPVQYFPFEMKLKRAVQAMELKRGRSLLLNVGGVTRVISTADILYIEVMDHDLTYHTTKGNILVRGKLSSVERELADQPFFRCGASYIIHLRHVTQMSGETVQVGGCVLPVSRARRKELMSAMAAFLGRGV